MSQNPGNPILLLQAQPDRSAPARLPENIVMPPRVHMAMSLISMLNQKSEPTIVSCGGDFEGSSKSYERVEGEKLTESEVVAHNAACDLVADYFAGRFKPDIWEKPIQSSIERRCKSRGAKKAKARTAHHIQCPKCGGGAFTANCDICGGDGNVIVFRKRDV